MSKRENEFPATSISRSTGARLQAQPPASPAHEAHPLLSPGPSSPTPSEQGHAVSGSGATLSVNGGPRYVPYTPRQRVTATSATTGMTVHPHSPQQHQGDATSKLQLMHLKAAAQAIGLDSGTLGWTILEKLVVDVETSDEWLDIWQAITSGKATLLLPLESTFSNFKITPDFLKDHIVLCEGSSRKSLPIVTLSGLRGTLDGEVLTLRSTINTTSKLFQDLLNPATRASALACLPPLPVPLSDVIPPVPYPQYHIPHYSPALHLPPRSQASSKPPLPPRPAGRLGSSTTNSVPSRITNPFASLFGSKPSTPAPSSPPSSLHSLDSTIDPNASFEIPAFTIGRKIVRKDLAKEINKSLKNELKAGLASTASLGNIPVPSWVAERVHDMTADWYPFIKSSSGSSKSNKDSSGNGHGYIVNPIEESPDDAAERLQDFYLELEQDMRAGGTPFIPRRREKEGEAEAEDEKDREKRENDRMESETRVREVMEAVERIITSLFYDRLFMQSTTDDASHDEALTSRVAALNMLDLGLGHLGIEVGDAVNEPELDAVVKACGELLSQLDTCRSPGDKSALLVAAHRVVVDGLSRLPPIRLISEHDADQDVDEDPQTARPTKKFENSEDGQAETIDKSSCTDAQSANKPAIDAQGREDANIQSSPDNSSSAPDIPTAPSKVKSPPPPLPLDSPAPPPVPVISQLQRPTPPKEPTPVSGDVLLPMIIFSVVKANPPHLVSNLLFTQRFRNQSVGGEESYCLINLMAVAEFLENVDMAGLGLGDSDKVMSTADLTPIPLTRSPVTSETPLEPLDGGQGLRGRVGQQVDAIADSANKVISGVVDSSFGILRSFMPAGVDPKSPASGRLTPGTPGSRPAGFGLLRRESGFSIASLAASLPITGRSRSNTGAEESGQQLVTVSRPSSVRSRASLRIKVGGEDSQDEASDSSSATSNEDDSEVDGEEEGAEYEDDDEQGHTGVGDARSIRSFESMLSASKEKSKMSRARKSLSDRLASVSALAGRKGGSPPPESRRSSLLHPQPSVARPVSPVSSRAASPIPLRLPPPKQRFLECNPDDLRLSEVGELLREYRRLVEGIRTVGGFDE
ncbi:Vacuolar protein sorting-associated protein 9A [Psilocybe cubensis]|uniref:VPS9 domain-containing protein n=2 Tax=Psilocybe cubensis TaxID=181762 RepID=A0A8H7XTR3_PSICU|nr:Vacuolar protein sorting-associated protein 9A [Psilocybe cubensis]KAH9479835.1 Vacuolar protein sorting-associated protein 9A [Psilocybe cubensis]